MTKHFQNEIERLKKKILRLAAMVEEALCEAVGAIGNHDIKMATALIQADEEIDKLEVEVEEDCLKILALHQPVAADLRYTIAVLKINNDLERIADLAVNIAKRTVATSVGEDLDPPFDLRGMLDATVNMVRKSVDALVDRDVDLAHQVRVDDDVVDEFHKVAFAAIQDRICANPDNVGALISLLSVSRNLERIADHATNIAEDVIYLIDGEIVRHRGLDDT
ncbi:MAG: phosphate signaling complex protein PhoU, partial [Candidatus Zixiibacteriota bacterium]